MSDLHQLELLARYAASLDVAALPADTQPTARACLLYGLAVGIATKRAQRAARIRGHGMVWRVCPLWNT